MFKGLNGKVGTGGKIVLWEGDILIYLFIFLSFCTEGGGSRKRGGEGVGVLTTLSFNNSLTLISSVTIQTFRPQKKFQEGSLRYELHKRASVSKVFFFFFFVRVSSSGWVLAIMWRKYLNINLLYYYFCCIYFRE